METTTPAANNAAWTARIKETLAKLEGRARHEVEAIPRQLGDALSSGLVARLDRAVALLKERLDLASREDVRALSAQIEELGKKVDRLATRDRGPTKASKVVRLPKKN